MPVDTSRQETRALRSGWMPRRGRAEAAPGPHRAGGATELQPVAQRLGAAWPGFRSFRGSEEALISFPMETFIPLLAAAPVCEPSLFGVKPNSPSDQSAWKPWQWR